MHLAHHESNYLKCRSMYQPTLSTLWGSFLLLFSLSICAAESNRLHPRHEGHDEEVAGHYVSQELHTTSIRPPQFNFSRPFSNCDDGSYIFISPRGYDVDPNLYILDHHGELIWASDPDHAYGSIYNFQVQQYKGKPYLTFWGGDDSVRGHGEGTYYTLDENYQLYKEIKADGGVKGDFHTFSITPDDTAVFSAYEVVQADLSSIGITNEDAHIWDSLFQEIDIETGGMLFQWRASEHFMYKNSYAEQKAASKAFPLDFFHINSVEKDKAGNYLVSSREGHAVLYIGGRNADIPGQIIWQLGGKRNYFRDLTGGSNSTTFVGQHDARWVDGPDGEHIGITLFDNGGTWSSNVEGQSVGRYIEIDLEMMTANLTMSFEHPDKIFSPAQGSYQTLPNGNVLLGYGTAGVLTEFTPNGTVLCDGSFDASADLMPQSNTMNVQSYRNYKFNWTGSPLTKPTVLYEDGQLYVSWLGSTKVTNWVLRDADIETGPYSDVQTVSKNGFETSFRLDDRMPMRKFAHVAATDAIGTQLSISYPIDLGSENIWDLNAFPEIETPESEHDEAEHDEAGNDEEEHDVPEHDEPDHHEEQESGSMYILAMIGLLISLTATLIACVNLRRRSKGQQRYVSNGAKANSRMSEFRWSLRSPSEDRRNDYHSDEEDARQSLIGQPG